MGNFVFVIHRPARQVLAAGLRTFPGGKGDQGEPGLPGTNGLPGAPGADGVDGVDGISISSVAIDANKHLIITLSDGSTHDAGQLPASSGGGGGAGVSSFNTRTGPVTLESADVSGALGYTPANSSDLADVAISGAYTDLLGLPAIPAAPGDIGAATAAQGAKADTAVQPAALAGKVDVDGTKVLSDENYTSAEKAKLAGLEAAHFKGLHASLAALQAAHPSAVAGDYADVDSGAGADVARYIWDTSDSAWIIQSGATGSMTAAQIKTAYESNPDTNAFSDTEQAKLGAIEAGAQVNAAAASQAEAEAGTGTALRSWTVQRVWQAIAAWWAASAMKTKLDGIATGATANSADATLLARANHTGTQAASTISDLTEVTQDVVGAMIVAGSNVSVTYDDVAGALTISASGGGGSVVGACQAAFDGGGSDVAVGSACEIRMPYAMTISKVTVLGDAAGSISVDVRVDSLANYPPLAGDSIVGASPPQLSGSASSEDSTLSGWTTAIAAGSVLRFVVSACSGIGRATVILEGVRS